MKRNVVLILLLVSSLRTLGQETTPSSKERLDFAKTYFELGGTYFPSFTGKKLSGNDVTSFKNSSSLTNYLTWGGFHFWGHAEFYVTFPLSQHNFTTSKDTDFQLTHSVATGARFHPWAYREKKIRPYVGLSWSALDFKQEIKPASNQPILSKDIMLNYEAGFVYGYKNFALRLATNCFSNNTWQYPVSKTQKEEIKTPSFSFQAGLLYTMDFSRRTDKETADRWNAHPRLSKQSLGSVKTGDFFIGIGPSLSFSLSSSAYNQANFPYLKSRLASNSYFDIAAGYHLNKIGLFTALSFRNPTFETEGYDTKQTIRKTSLALEVNKFLMDYSGFTPYLGVNLAFDKITYTESVDDVSRELKFENTIEPGITIGWDIQPGKNEEALILRTNLRWYPFSSFQVDGQKFNFSQLEYNLIQVVLYPDRLKKKKK